MFRHIVLFRWSAEADADALDRISAGLDRMAQLPMVADYTHGPDAGVSEGTADYAIVATFDSFADYQAYATEPSHVALIADTIRPHVAERAAVQYEF